MNRQNWKVWVLSLAIVAVVGPAVHARNGQPSKSELQQMGLGGMTIVSDQEAMNVRGLGFAPIQSSSAHAFGGSAALLILPGPVVIGGAGSLNVYDAEGTFIAKGHNSSHAGASISTVQTVPGVGAIITSTTFNVWAGGSSWAKAF